MDRATTDSEIRLALRSISAATTQFFEQCSKVTFTKPDDLFGLSSSAGAEHYWSQLTDALRASSTDITEQVLNVSSKVADSTKGSALAGSEDLRDVKQAAKRIRAALRLRRYFYHEADVLHDEGSVLGVRPASQSETCGLSPVEAEAEFQSALAEIGVVLKLVEASGTASSPPAASPSAESAKYRAGTAFIMMWMDPQHPELIDVADAVRSVFRSFGIKAVRADDIEHEGLITERVLNEIRLSEFLFGDLTGMRPNVYYEVGFAHALGKRVILFRRSGTGLHFDLAGYNCPEHENLKDLREKLTKRLVHVTNRNPGAEQEI